jgi:hypothetical protein
MSPERKNPLQNLGVAKQSTETREDYLACILKLSQKRAHVHPWYLGRQQVGARTVGNPLVRKF